MLIYKYKGDKCLKSNNLNDYSIKNCVALKNYNENLISKDAHLEEVIRQVFNTYNTLCKFNNTLVNVKDINYGDFEFVKEYLESNADVKNCIDSKCRSIYDNLNNWYNKINNDYSLDEIKWQVVKSMKFYERLGIFSIASINLKRNYYDFTI